MGFAHTGFDHSLWDRTYSLLLTVKVDHAPSVLLVVGMRGVPSPDLGTQAHRIKSLFSEDVTLLP